MRRGPAGSVRACTIGDEGTTATKEVVVTGDELRAADNGPARSDEVGDAADDDVAGELCDPVAGAGLDMTTGGADAGLASSGPELRADGGSIVAMLGIRGVELCEAVDCV
ncbi:hypothetical protein M5689_000569 [Euphorbia peplus]|nr:hypothetical protein M5689_000569 [Euphorbia peplus]